MKSILALFLALPLQAVPIIYTLSSTGSGDIGGMIFNNVSFTITSTADTAGIYTCGVALTSACNPSVAATIAITGLPAATFLEDTVFFDNPNPV